MPIVIAPPPSAAQSPYRSFWIGGFEGADHVNGAGTRLDMVETSGHALHLEADYRRLARLGICSVRESIGWRLCESGAPEASWRRFDFTRVERFAAAAQRQGIQILWSLMHYGMPAGVSLLDDAFVERFAEFAGAAARVLRPRLDEAPVYTPINEINFLAWAIAATDLLQLNEAERAGREESRRQGVDIGWAVKQRLIRAALAGMAAIRSEDPRARFLHVEPLIHVVAAAGQPERAAAAADVAGWQWQAWDMLSGRLCPELGGSEAALDLLGVNYYHNCQWELDGEQLAWPADDPRRLPCAALLRQAAERYARPLLIAETSHVGVGRAAWLDEVAGEVEQARRGGLDVLGICLYPIVDRPDWNDLAHWHHSGLWDVDADPARRRRLAWPYARELRRWQRRLPTRLPASHAVARPPSLVSLHANRSMTHLIAFSHLRWDFVYQRPQHLLSRLAARFPVVFIEEPVRCEGPAWLECSAPAPGVQVLRPHTPVDAGGFHDDQLSVLEPLLADWLHKADIDDTIVWFYTPMALPLLGELAPRAVVYDCMDELSAFRGAPKQMRQRETALLKRAQLVLTGGPSLFEAKRDLHPHVLCLPSAVDAAHYDARRAAADAAAVQRAAVLQAAFALPRLGFFGVIDERLDLGLVAALADAEPSWQIVMVGPVVKIDPASLPQRANLHWLGQQPYALLPQLVAGWSVCLMPFALNESTRFISPTKTLEYMAAGKPVVSTRIRDVAVMFASEVAIADTAEGFVAACRKALAETSAQAERRAAAMARVVAAHSWQATVETIAAALDALLAAPAHGSRPGAAEETTSAVPQRVAAGAG